MASPFLLFACSLLLLLQGTQGEKFELNCEFTPPDHCVFSVNTQGNWCILVEDHFAPNYTKCIDSGLPSVDQQAYYEDIECMDVCGVYIYMKGLPTVDSIKKYPFIQQLCSQECSLCKNIIDVYSTIAKKDGIDLRDLCKRGQEAEKQAKEMEELQ